MPRSTSIVAAGAVPEVLFDFKSPDANGVFAARLRRLQYLRANPEMLGPLKNHYRICPADFIDEWGVTYDPRLVERGLPATVPFVLFPKQREWVEWVMRRWKAQRPGLSEKSRDWGLSYLAVTLGCTLCLFNEGMSIGYGSRKEDYVDKVGQPKSLFWKARLFMENLPVEFRGDWETWRDAPHMRITFPATGSVMTGEAGDNIGRGDRQGIFFVDESAHLERPHLVDLSLSQTTNCRIDMSSVNGMNNPFAQKRWAPREDQDFLFICDWKDDPRKDEAWYEKQKIDLEDPVIVAQEIDRDYSASVEGIVIPGAWVRAAIDAREKLKIGISGAIEVAYDPADEGDPNALVGGQGIDVSIIEEWAGKGSDTFASVQRVFELCTDHELTGFRYDSDGLGASVRGDARVINDQRRAAGLPELTVAAYRGSAEVVAPEGEDVKGRKNKDYFANHKAQSWWGLRRRFQLTHRWVVNGVPCAHDDLISISSKAPKYLRLVAELSQATYKQNGVGKMLVDKSPDGMKSPNLADALVIRYAKLGAAPMLITEDVLSQLAKAVRAPRGRR